MYCHIIKKSNREVEQLSRLVTFKYVRFPYMQIEYILNRSRLKRYINLEDYEVHIL